MQVASRAGLTVAVLLVAVAGVVAAPSEAAPAGTRDPGFGSGGVTAIRAPTPEAGAVLFTAGRIIVVGSERDGRDVVVRGLEQDGKAQAGYGPTVPTVPGAAADEGVTTGALDPVLGRLVVLASVVSGGENRNVLLGFDAQGRLDPSFGDAGRVMLPGAAYPGGLAVLSDGTVLVGVGSSDPGKPGVLSLTQVSAAGVVTRVAVDDQAATFDPPVLVPLADGSTLVAYNDANGLGAVMVRLDAAGASEPAFGDNGLVRLGAQVQVDAATILDPGDVLLAGSHLVAYSRSGPEPANPMLAKVSLGGQVAHGFGHIGRGVSTVSQLSAVVVDGDRILASTPAGLVVSFHAFDGRPDIAFGIGGVSPAFAPPFVGGGPLAIDGDSALVAGVGAADLQLARVRLRGSGVLAPRAGRQVTVMRTRGTVNVQVPIAAAEQPLRAPVAAMLPVAQVNQGEEGIYSPPATTVDAISGTARIEGVGGTALVRGVRATLRRARSAVAVLNLDLDRHACGGAPTITARGRFVIAAGRVRLQTDGRRTQLRVRCNASDPITVLVGRVHHDP
jgi:hypothetical protein